MNILIEADRPIRDSGNALPARRTSPWLGGLLLVLGVTGFSAVWIMLGAFTSRQNSWMAVIAALDIAWMLRLGGWKPGLRRAAAGVAATGLIVLLANWGITATHLGKAMGLQVWTSASKLGFDHAWTLAQLANGVGDLLWLAMALVIAALASR